MFENVFVGKVVLLEVKEFHGLQDDLKIIWKTFNPWPLSGTENMSTLKNGVHSMSHVSASTSKLHHMKNYRQIETEKSKNTFSRNYDYGGDGGKIRTTTNELKRPESKMLYLEFMVKNFDSKFRFFLFAKILISVQKKNLWPKKIFLVEKVISGQKRYFCSNKLFLV